MYGTTSKGGVGVEGRVSGRFWAHLLFPPTQFRIQLVGQSGRTDQWTVGGKGGRVLRIFLDPPLSVLPGCE